MPVMCLTCEKQFSTQFNLNKHSRLKHNVNRQHYSYDGNKFNFLCLECKDSSFRNGDDLIFHLRSKHSLHIEDEEKEFNTIEEFKSWKANMENKEKCSYVIYGGKNKLASGDVIQYFRCCRSGGNQKGRLCGPTTVANRQRNQKTQGSAKLSYACISKITLKIIENRFYVRRIITHYGHLNQIEHLRISQLDKKHLAAKLVDGVPNSKILDGIRDNISTNLKRIDLVTRQDLDNIKRSYNICQQDGVKHKNDAVSVELWIEECKTLHNNPVLLYKAQGQPCENFLDSDFVLIIMNEIQASLLSQFGKNIIAIDSTHGMNNYDFEMTTLMIVDEFNEGFPVALMFTNRKDTLINVVFFRAIKNKVGVILCRTFMSDLCETFYAAWAEVMGISQHQLYCSWHVDRAWRTNLNKVTKSNKRVAVYKTLKYIQKIAYISLFHEQLNSAILHMLDDPDTKKFGDYFVTYYTKNYMKWAYCYRKDCGINTNMKLESMHKVIKYFYLSGKHVKRLDKGLHATLKYVRDKIVDRMVKHTKGKQNMQQTESFKRHRVAITSSFIVNSDSNESYSVIHDNNQYHVKKTNILEKCCKTGCDFCNICIHQYSCSCPDYFLNSVICKHIHYVVLKNVNTSPLEKNNRDNGVIGVSECMDFFTATNVNPLCDKKERIMKEISDLTMLLNTHDVTKLSDSNFQLILSNLNVTKNLIRLPASQEEEHFQPIMEMSACKNILPQNRFYSTKKKRQLNTSTQILKNPSMSESKNISSVLKGDNVAYISRDAGEDHSYR
ncbi:unnamed protein product [Callosobruchus maculatus]|uniref:C2H2-type domain-containing protein n=1 Tax=Callosobruchus maculatus TaxID=64391 RepID=A0A653DDQ9_CALMS|nr:unnamed protein product [Callosobruchus maculatus]